MTARIVAARIGADLKMGLGPNLTLETAINPDFGQVEADPSRSEPHRVRNAVPEKRPFFLEGAQLFNIGHPNFYYSRRIGARPTGPAADDFVDYPNRLDNSRRREADRTAAVEDVARFPRPRPPTTRARIWRAPRLPGHDANRAGRRARLSRRRPGAAGVRSRRIDRRVPCELHASRSRARVAAGQPLLAQRSWRWPGTRCCASKEENVEVVRASGGGSLDQRRARVDRTLSTVQLALRTATRPDLLGPRSDAPKSRADGPRR